MLTCAFAVLEGIARLAGESLVAAEGAQCVHAVLAPAARVQVCDTLIDVCGDRDGTSGYRALPGGWMGTQRAARNGRPLVYASGHSIRVTEGLPCANKHCGWRQDTW